MITTSSIIIEQSMLMALMANGISGYTFFESRFRYFFNPRSAEQHIPDFRNFSAEYIWDRISYGNNRDMCVMILGEDNGIDNKDIDFVLVHPSSPITERYYTTDLFNAFYECINPQWAIDSFDFTKACQIPDPLGSTGSCDFIFRINFKDPGVNPLYWDLSSSIPPKGV